MELELVFPFQNLQPETHFAWRPFVFMKCYPVSVSIPGITLALAGHRLPPGSVLLPAAPQMMLLH